MDHEMFEGNVFSEVKFLKLVKSQKSIADIIAKIKSEVDALKVDKCNIDNLTLIQEYHQFLIEGGYEKEQSVFDFVDKIISLIFPVGFFIVGFYQSHVSEFLDLYFNKGKLAIEVEPILSKNVDDFASIIFQLLVAGFLIYFFMFVLQFFISNKDKKHKEKLRIAYSILEKHFEEKIQELKK